MSDAPANKDDEKHLQLGADPADDDRTEIEDPDEIEDVWADVTTVEQFKIDIEALAAD